MEEWREGEGKGWDEEGGRGGWSKVKEGEMVRGRRGREKENESGVAHVGRKRNM